MTFDIGGSGQNTASFELIFASNGTKSGNSTYYFFNEFIDGNKYESDNTVSIDIVYESEPDDPRSVSEDTKYVSDNTKSASDDPTSASDDPTSASDDPTSASDDPTSASDDPTSASDVPTSASDNTTSASNDPASASDDPTSEIQGKILVILSQLSLLFPSTPLTRTLWQCVYHQGSVLQLCITKT